MHCSMLNMAFKLIRVRVHDAFISIDFHFRFVSISLSSESNSRSIKLYLKLHPHFEPDEESFMTKFLFSRFLSFLGYESSFFSGRCFILSKISIKFHNNFYCFCLGLNFIRLENWNGFERLPCSSCAIAEQYKSTPSESIKARPKKYNREVLCVKIEIPNKRWS